MPITYHFDRKQRCVLSEFSGVIEDADLLEHVRQVLADPGIEEGSTSLVDMRAVTDYRVSSECVRQAADLTRDFARVTHRALVVGDDLMFGMSRVFKATRDGDSTDDAIFRDIDEARAWLGLD